MCDFGDAVSSASGQNILIPGITFSRGNEALSSFATGQLGLVIEQDDAGHAGERRVKPVRENPPPGLDGQSALP